jgi:membrane fusion protein
LTLFRSEAVERQSTRLEGDVFVGVPITWQIIGFFLFAVVAAAIVFLALATYPRFEVARGVVQPDLGVAIVLPPAPGTVIDVLVESGESVMPGQTLIAVEAQDFLATGQSASIQIIDALLQQKASVETQIAAARDESAADMRRLEAQIRGLDAEILLIDEQIILQESRVASAAADVEEIRLAVDRVSSYDVISPQGSSFMLTRFNK